MRNRAPNHIIKITNDKIKGIVDRKQFIDTEMMCQKAMTELRNIYWYEKQLLIAIPILIQSATTFELVESLTMQLIKTREHLKLLEANFPSIDKVSEPKINTTITPKRSMNKVML